MNPSSGRPGLHSNGSTSHVEEIFSIDKGKSRRRRFKQEVTEGRMQRWRSITECTSFKHTESEQENYSTSSHYP